MVIGIRSAQVPLRAFCGAIFALLLALRLLGATGYMPAIEHGRLAIVVCPDADISAPLAIGAAHHHHGKTPHAHEPCPYASASSLGASASDVTPLLDILIVGIALLLGRTLLFVERNSARERPPTRAPPLPV